MEQNIKIFTLSSNKPLAQEIAQNMGLELGACEVKRFADGEVNVQINETVRGADCFVIQSTCPPVNDNLMELLIMCDALKRASANSISVVIPYYGYSRSDKKSRSRMPITSKLIADMLEKYDVTAYLSTLARGSVERTVSKDVMFCIIKEDMIKDAMLEIEDKIARFHSQASMVDAIPLNSVIGVSTYMALSNGGKK